MSVVIIQHDQHPPTGQEPTVQPSPLLEGLWDGATLNPQGAQEPAQDPTWVQRMRVDTAQLGI
jgi:hypothetical protein